MANENKLTTLAQMQEFATRQDARDDQQEAQIQQMQENLENEQMVLHAVTTAGTGAAYTATVEGIDSLVSGATFIMIPHTVSTALIPTLDVNGLGAKRIRRRVSNSTVTTVAASSENWLGANKPVIMIYDGTYWIADFARPNANDIYGTVAIASGGTNASTEEAACANLSALRYVAQDLTEDQQAQARANIGLDGCATQDSATLGAELATASGWTLGAGWSGSLEAGFTHASGNTEALTFTPSAIKAGSLYQVTFKSSVRMTTTNLFVQVGNSTQFNLYAEDSTSADGKVSIGVLAADTSGLVFTPDSSFTGTLTEISLREITGTYEAVKQYFDTNNAVSFEIHVTPRGLENVFIGQAVGEMNTSGHENVGIGVNAMMRNTSGFWNVAIGKDCLKNNTAGSRNLGLGYNALLSNEVGQRNVALGTFTMTSMRSGNWNVAIGSDAMNTATGGDKNVAVGFNTLTNNAGNNNIAVGAAALSRNTSGVTNVGVGSGALGNNTTGGSNVCIGYNAGIANTTANGNVAIGWAALYKNTTGAQNVAIGCGAGKAITTGKLNIIIGVEPEVNATGNYQLNIGDLLKGSLVSGAAYLLVNGGLRLPNIPTAAPGNDGVYAEEWTFVLEDGSTVTKKVLLK